VKVLVTGGAGFIGSHLVDALLLNGHQVAVLDDLSSGNRDNLPTGIVFFEQDIRNASGVLAVCEKFQPDVINHQAAQLSVSRSVHEPAYDAEVNICGLINVCTAATHVKAKRLIFASSGGVLYGEVADAAPEETPAHPVSPYGISKWAGEQYLQFFQRQHDLSTVALRYANVYGERQNPHGEAGVVAIFCTRLLKGEAATINGDGKYLRDYVHVSDVVRANVAAIESDLQGFEAINIGTGLATDVNQLGSILQHCCRQTLVEHQVPVSVPDFLYGPARAGDLRSNLVLNRKARQVLGWSPRVDLEAGLTQTVEWFAKKILPPSTTTSDR